MHHPKQQDAERGQALAEFALTIPIFLMLVFGIIDLARLVFGFTQVIDAARQGVRYGIVEGLEKDTRQYLDCAGIRDKVKDTPGLIPGSAMDVKILYLNPVDGSLLHNCTSGNPPQSVLSQDVVLEVTVTGQIVPLTPLLALFDNSIGFDYTSERTIATKGAYYTDEWPEGPPVPRNFQAQVNCENEGRVSFTWEGWMGLWPDRIEIRNSYTNQVAASMSYPETQWASCEDNNPTGRQPCGTNISPDGGSGMWYMVVIHNGMEGTSSNDATANCAPIGGPGGEVGGLVSVVVSAYGDNNRNGRKDGVEAGFPWLTVEAYYAGADGKDGTADDVFLARGTTGDGGLYTFTDLWLPAGVRKGNFFVRADRPPGYTGIYPSALVMLRNLEDGASATVQFGVG